MADLVQEMTQDKTAASLQAIRKGKVVDIGLVNHFQLHDLIPNKWFDWTRRADASIMIIGQDWGPYIALKHYMDDYEAQKDSPDFNYDKFLFSGFSSRTEKFILKAITEAYFLAANDEIPQEKWNDIIFTMSVLFTRQGKHFRGTEFFDNEKSRNHSFSYVSRQIDIVKPKVIMTLGGMAWQTVAEHFSFTQFKGQTVTQVIQNVSAPGYIQLEHTTIIPNFHPASHVSPAIMKKIWQSKPFLDALV